MAGTGGTGLPPTFERYPGGVDLPTRPNHPTAAGIARKIASLLLLAVLVAGVTAWKIVHFYDRRIDRTSIAPPDVDAARPPAPPTGTENWLLVGSDVRSGSDAAHINGARSDSIMIVHFGGAGATTVVSVPRDLNVPVPARTDRAGKRHPAHTGKVNDAFNDGGPALLVATLEQLTGLRIGHYAEIDFGGFREITTAIGGVDVCLLTSSYVESFTLDNGRRVHATNLDDPASGFRGRAGSNHLVGDIALAFVRQRHGFADGDISRIRRQQAFLGAVFRKITSGEVLRNPGRLAGLLGSMTGSMVLDDKTGITDLLALADRLKGTPAGKLRFTTVPLTGQVDRPVFYFTYDPGQVRAFFRKIAPPADGRGPAPPAPMVPAPHLRVDGVAARAAAAATPSRTPTGRPYTQAPVTAAADCIH